MKKGILYNITLIFLFRTMDTSDSFSEDVIITSLLDFYNTVYWEETWQYNF